MKKLRAAIIGSGNLATHLVPALQSTKQISLICLHSRNEDSGLALCKENKIAYAKSYASIPKDVQVVFIMTSDAGIGPVSNLLSEHLASNTFIVHFSGSEALESISPHFVSCASAWPIQSISSIDTDLDLKATPFCISSSDPLIEGEVTAAFSQISDHVFTASEKEKSILHISAVIANNFSTHLFSLSKQLLDSHGLDFKALKAIILKTALNAITYDPAAIQTGPASRNDKKVIEKHEELLKDNANLLKVYKVISESIKNR